MPKNTLNQIFYLIHFIFKNGPKCFKACFLFLLLSTVSACGFRPIYSSNSGLKQVLDSVVIGQVTGQKSRNVKQALLSLFPNSEPSLYHVNIKLKTENIAKGITINDIASRKDYRIIADYSVYDKNGKHILTNEARVTTSYSVPASPYAALNAAQDAEQRAIQALAKKIRFNLAQDFIAESKQTKANIVKP